jgi:hypothetical protein
VFTENLPEGSKRRLERIQELRGGDERQALEYCITIGWLQAEKEFMKRKKK